MVHNLLRIKIAPDFQRVTLARYMADTNQPENTKFCTNWVQKFKAMKILSSCWNRREKGKGKHRGIGLGWQKRKGSVLRIVPAP